VKICIELVKKVKKYGFSDRTQSVEIARASTFAARPARR